MSSKMEDEELAKDKASLQIVKTGAEGEAVPPEPTPTPEAETPPAPAPAPPPTPSQGDEPGLPSPHQNHTKNWVEKTRVDWQSFKIGHDALVAELNGLDAAFDADQAKRKADFDAETNRLAAAHDLKREELVDRINDMLDGLAVTEKAIETYNERLTPKPADNTEEQQ